jgi:hypothetical protein
MSGKFKRSSFVPYSPIETPWSEVVAKKEWVKARLKEIKEQQEAASIETEK